MKRMFTTAAFLGLGLLPAAAQDYTFAIAAGLSPAEARVMSLTEIAAAKFNRDSDADDRQTVIAAKGAVYVDPVRHAQLIAAAKLAPEQASGLTLSELGAGKYNAGTGGDDQQVYMSSRGPIREMPAQLIAAAGLTPAEARGMSLNEVYAAKLASEGHGNYEQ